MFLVVTEYQKGVEEIERFLPAHSAFLEQYYQQKKVVFSGRRNPRVGGMILFNVGTEQEVEGILAQDPFKQNGIAAYNIMEFIPTKYDERFACFLG